VVQHVEQQTACVETLNRRGASQMHEEWLMIHVINHLWHNGMAVIVHVMDV
jgi:hypothetical protein